MTDQADDFVELSAAKPKPKQAKALMGVVELRHATRMTISLDGELIAGLEGYPRFTIAWSAATFTLRIRGNSAGEFEAYKTQKGGRYIIRLAVPDGVAKAPAAKDIAPYRREPDALYLVVPPSLRPKPKVPALPAPGGIQTGRSPSIPIVPRERVGR